MVRTQSTTPDSALDIAVEEREAWRRRLTITVDAARVARARRKERKRLSGKLRLKGFRAGKVPQQVIEQRYGELVDQRTVQHLVEDAYREAVRRHHLEPIGAPEFGEVRYARGENLTFQVDIEIMPTLKLDRLGGFRIRRPEVSASEDDVEAVVQRLREERGVWEAREGSPEEGDLVAVRITRLGEEGGAAGTTGPESGSGVRAPGTPSAEGGEAELYRFPLGSGYAIEEVEKAIYTLRPGEGGTFTVRFPEDFGDAALAGKTRQLEIELAEIQHRRLVPLDDDFASEVGDFKTLEALQRQVREDLLRHREEEAEQTVRDAIMDSIIQANSFDVPASLVESYLDRLMGSGPGEGENDEVHQPSEARTSVRPIAEQQLKRELVLENVIEHLNIDASDDDVDSFVRGVAERRGADAAELRRRWLREGGPKSLRRRVVVDRAFEHLKGLSTIE
ncbi:MAG: trigger factor [Gemmatimonadota bacterium]